ncbi:MAG TPA: hypothetical protein VN625_10430 [Desulfuromonadaceae bacterium]|nr:hypothetical protein [Desulfuromonadaceae bacterium]
MNAKSLVVAAIFSFFVQPVFSSETVSTDKFAADATAFLQTEIAAHVAAITNVDPPQAMVLGVPTKGDFTWGSFMRALAQASVLTGETNIDGRDVPAFLGKLGLIESRLGAKTFSQLGSALTLRHFGMNLETNALWQSLSPSEQDEWRALLNPARFYDLNTHHVIGLPENYMGVAARIITMDVQFGLVTNRDVAGEILERAAGQFLHGALYTDDNVPTGRYDRYSQEYARFVYEAAGNIGRKDIQDATAPSIHATINTWWAIVDQDGYSFPWGRTIGDNSYMDTLDIIGFLADHPEFRPASLQDLTSVYYAAWNSLMKDYEKDRHLLNMFKFGRGSYHYVTVERQWQQTTGFFYKAGESLEKLIAAWRAENVSGFPAQANLPDVARFDFFRNSSSPPAVPSEDGRQAGVWLVRNWRLHFALPITTGGGSGFRAGLSDYQPAPHGLAGFAAPVEQIVPVLTPFLYLTNGQTIAACDGADQIVPDKDGFGFTATWHRFANINVAALNTNIDLPFGEPEKFVEAGLTSKVHWRLDGDTLVRTEKITAMKTITIRNFWVSFPGTAGAVTIHSEHSPTIYIFLPKEGGNNLEVSAEGDGLKFAATLAATGNSDLGKGTRRPIPLVMDLEAHDVKLKAGKSLTWTLRIRLVRNWE